MAEFKSVLITLIIHFVFRKTLFFEYRNCCSSLMKFPSVMILSSIAALLTDVELIPKRFQKKGPAFVSSALEVLGCVFYMEFSMLFIWYRLELMAIHVLEAWLSEIYGNKAIMITNFAIFLIATSFLTFAVMVTNVWEQAKKMLGSIVAALSVYLRKLCGICGSQGADANSYNITLQMTALPKQPGDAQCAIKLNGCGDTPQLERKNVATDHQRQSHSVEQTRRQHSKKQQGKKRTSSQSRSCEPMK
ncbi:CLUMA_CG020737, isoform A [Clunio marinus]|uniref:CLUMA_CG020737, isoform A n=1 Tax=Clunio marinus TaxID=568069 RepID=A0A1J1J5W4_9DIPT|nr:CLUMA_CG020737, isoform A [Clunio marinus]